jgi:hypothetical protein
VEHVVLFIWNNLETDPPPVSPEVHLIRASRNDMMNRYTLTQDFPHTNSILNVDDDVFLPEGLLRCMLVQLLAHNTSIVGLFSSPSNWYGPEGRRSACVRWLFEHFGDDSLFKPRSVRKQIQCVS